MEKLSNHFTGIAVKLLSEVEINPRKSNQHELQGVQRLREILGNDRRDIKTTCIYLADDEVDRLSQDGQLTWYDSREKNPSRSAEFRLYYRSSNEPLKSASAGDTLIYAHRPDASLLLVVVPKESNLRMELLWLFGIYEEPGELLDIVDPNDIEFPTSLFNYIAEEAGIPVNAVGTNDDWTELLLNRFGLKFPTTRELSSLALETLDNDIDPVVEPDTTLMALIEREEILFKQLERHIVSEHLVEHAAGWSEDVDDFISFSLSVQNRRKSRAGHALENHLEWLFGKNGLQFERGARTENRSKPDFLFPGSAAYHDSDFPSSHLHMLGVKTSCKDRWRQILNEAQRISPKHLLTLQPGISEYQLTEMIDSEVQLVVPSPLQCFYSKSNAENLFSFIRYIKDQQCRKYS
ncbi:type II restriction endonuclease [Bacterioplanes sanyensis]|uniref:type II restriction endonuclease n=1 Tax=Bacterioplanes sanyensis TaxID=1249553 RepID=UPI0019952503|nr:type II restriction endonuclease [Bacterioplanes sanyensis]GGY50353.1 type II restriction endonuclease [Bacterioplanes sanyensis]